ncbi:MAG TPA: aminotransferase class I/II-fold pyridoxal phosphate-dependent enzyme [Actinocrinis sp.]|nr:aminotransferase class I/II-fold pyridoxal phosphate-dependent enzyme [Actinocrinis sp.]
MTHQRQDIIDLSSGQVVEPLPPAIRARLMQALDAQSQTTAYAPAPGDPDLRSAVAGHYRSRSAREADPEEITVTAGVRHGLFVALATVAAGGEVLMPRPHWSHYPAVIERAGAKAVAVPGDPARGLLVGAEDLEAARTAETRAVLVNSPVNPTGSCHDARGLREIRDWAHERGITVITDDVYYAYADDVDTALRTHEEEIVVGGASKVFALAGLRVGWIWASPGLCGALRAGVEYTTGPVNTLAQIAAATALGDPAPVAQRAETLARQRQTAVRALTGIPGLTPLEPHGGIYLCLDAAEALAHRPMGADDDVALCRVLAEHAGVRLRAGSTFGLPGHLRLCVAVPEQTLHEAARRLAGFLAAGR